MIQKIRYWLYCKALNYVCARDINYRELRDWLDKDSGIFIPGGFPRYVGKMSLDFKWVDKRTLEEKEEERKEAMRLINYFNEKFTFKGEEMKFAAPVTFGEKKNG